MKPLKIKCRSVSSGKAEGKAVVTTQPLCFWGGFDPQTGRVIDRRHKLYGIKLSGKILVFPHGKGSVSSTAVIFEAIRLDTAPLAIVDLQTDPVLAVGAILAEKIYGKALPILDSPTQNPLDVIRTGDHVIVDADKGYLQVTTSNEE